MNDYRLKFLGFYMINLMINACSQPVGTEPPQTPSDVLNEKVRSVPWHYIDLDESNSREIKLSEDDIIYNVNQEPQENEPILGNIHAYTYTGELFYVYDLNAKAIFRITPDGLVEGPLTREGRGPGEHNAVGNLQHNTQYIFASDLNNARINRYDYNMVPKNPLMDFSYSLTMNPFILNEELILSDNHNSSSISPSKPKEGLVSVHPIHDLSDTLATILPRIIPVGYQPLVYHLTMFSLNNYNDIVASYMPLPWLFLYDDRFNHTQTLILEYSVFDEMDIPAMDFFKPQGNEGFGGIMPIAQYKLMDNGDVFITIPIRKDEPDLSVDGATQMQLPVDWELIQFSRDSDGLYSMVNKYKIMYEEPMMVMDIFETDTKGEYFAGNQEYLFRLVLPD